MPLLEALLPSLEALLAQPPWVLDIAIPLALTNAIYWGFGLFFLALDCISSTWWKENKCQRRAPPMPWADVRHITAVVGVQLVTVYPLVLWLGMSFSHSRLKYDFDSLPDLPTALGSFLFFAVSSEVYFYHVHRALHHPSVYPYVHKLHHAYTAPIALEVCT